MTAQPLKTIVLDLLQQSYLDRHDMARAIQIREISLTSLLTYEKLEHETWADLPRKR